MSKRLTAKVLQLEEAYRKLVEEYRSRFIETNRRTFTPAMQTERDLIIESWMHHVTALELLYEGLGESWPHADPWGRRPGSGMVHHTNLDGSLMDTWI